MYDAADVGPVVSIVKSYVFDAEFAFVAASVATEEPTVTATVPSEEPFTTSNVYVVPLPAKLLATGVPLFAVPVTVISPITKLDVDSLNVAVKDNVVSDTVSPSEPSEDVTTTVGELASTPGAVPDAIVVMAVPAFPAESCSVMDTGSAPESALSVFPSTTVYVMV